MKPINYYIQLSDELSTAIDAMGKEQLLELAQECLHYRMILKYPQVHQPYHIKESEMFMDRYGITCYGAVSLAHGCLAKAAAMSEV